MALDTDDLERALPGLMRYALMLTHSREAAEDLVQDVVVKALQRAESFRGEGSAAGWLHRIMHSTFIDGVRRRREEPTDPDLLAAAIEKDWRADDFTVDAAEVVARAQVREELRDALVHLPVHYRSAVVLADVQGCTGAEIAQVHGISLPAAKQRIRRGRQLLVSSLARSSARREALSRVPMNCWSARSQIDDYLDGALDDPQRGVLERHLRECPTCPALFTSLVGVRAGLNELRDPDTVVPPHLVARVQRGKRAAR